MTVNKLNDKMLGNSNPKRNFKKMHISPSPRLPACAGGRVPSVRRSRRVPAVAASVGSVVVDRGRHIHRSSPSLPGAASRCVRAAPASQRAQPALASHACTSPDGHMTIT